MMQPQSSVGFWFFLLVMVLVIIIFGLGWLVNDRVDVAFQVNQCKDQLQQEQQTNDRLKAENERLAAEVQALRDQAQTHQPTLIDLFAQLLHP